jgi:hypothetical protein
MEKSFKRTPASFANQFAKETLPIKGLQNLSRSVQFIYVSSEVQPPLGNATAFTNQDHLE